MRVSPITSTTPQPQVNPAFQARVPKNIVKQLIDKAEPLKSINILSKTGIAFTVPAFAAAKLYANNSDAQIDETKLASLSRVEKLPTSEELAKLSDEDLINIAQVQDADGNTIFHYCEDEALERFLDKAPHKTAAEVFMKKNNTNHTACSLHKQFKHLPENLSMAELLEDGIQKIATSGELSIEKAIQLLSENELNDNLKEFLEARKTKAGANSSINTLLYEELIAGIERVVYVDTPNGTYKDMPIETAALFFNTCGAQPDFASLDRKYLKEVATSDNLIELLNSAFLDPDARCIRDIMLSVSYDDIKDEIDPSKIKIEDIEMMIESVPKNNVDKMVKDLYMNIKNGGWNILHYSARRPDSDFGKHLQILDKHLGQQDINKIILSEDNRFSAPTDVVHADGKAAAAILDYYEQEPEMISKIFKHTDESDNNILHKIENTAVLEGLFDILEYESDELAEILGQKNKTHQTPYMIAYRDKPESSYTKLLENKIIELATDSDLSLNNSIELLENNKLAPQLQEFLKMQKEEKDA